MVYFFIAAGMLIAGYFVYGKFVERVFGADDSRPTPVMRLEDGVDFVKMNPKKIFLIQILNIAGLGPIFGPILGALYGPTALIWVVLGCIFGGAVHDYFSGMMSIRNEGKSLPELVGINLGGTAKQVLNVVALTLLILVGVVFVLGPAKLLAQKINFGFDAATASLVWSGVIFVYYFAATILPVDKIIGRIYPFFGAALLFMAFGLVTMLMVKGYTLFPNGVDFTVNTHPKDLPLWPLIFITIACGAISGFHATQSPMMARCLPKETMGRPVFFGAMIGEGLIGLIWVTLGMSFYQSPEALQGALANGGPAAVVDQISLTLMGDFGGLLAVLGVIALPITSGDTAFRSARLIIADYLKFSQVKASQRLFIAVPLFVLGFIITKTDFGILWRYFGLVNQSLAVMVLWTTAVYLARENKLHWIASIPATFMTVICSTYILYNKVGLGLDYHISCIAGVAIGFACMGWFLVKKGSLVPVPVK
ncbi:carbon starvation CstA family protein [Halodesulfovibrio spirochaetisodalis]|uniref:Carbon starvation protein CstA n=1 Tax=Halodesulfovibrio spirochaetisodalis TaxID=1560234 RepID=A0A1B7XBS0_9BACT|nr:carbon starvation protein A [Halodesulfovibrio spirochaetisodalis]OBQ50197.1 carbon starvation protein CstA [Halodesulfovibrio spirochaetisodalis]